MAGSWVRPTGWPAAPVHGTVMTLGWATEWLADRTVVGCACVGPMPPDRICPCHRTDVEARALHRAAHITAGVLLAATRRRENRT